MTVLDPDCRDSKHTSCVGGPCECLCHDDFLVVGIDPSLTATGIALTNGTTITVGGEAAYGDRRLWRIHHPVMEAAAGADLAVLEDLPTHAQGAGKTGMAQGVVRLALLELEVPYVLVVPSTLKKFATGSGNATKPDMRMAWYQSSGQDIRDDNQVDALWLRAMGLAHLGQHDKPLTKPQTAALNVVWPSPKAT